VEKFHEFQRLAIMTRQAALSRLKLFHAKVKASPALWASINCTNRRRRCRSLAIHHQRNACGRPLSQILHAVRQTCAINMCSKNGDFSDNSGKPALPGRVLGLAPPYY
jgi:hypothetical protein